MTDETTQRPALFFRAPSVYWSRQLLRAERELDEIHGPRLVPKDRAGRPPLRAIGYVRVSRGSIAEAERSLEAECRRRRLALVRVVTERHAEGAPAPERTGLLQVIASIRADAASVLVATASDLADNQTGLVVVVRQVEAARARLLVDGRWLC